MGSAATKLGDLHDEAILRRDWLSKASGGAWKARLLVLTATTVLLFRQDDPAAEATRAFPLHALQLSSDDESEGGGAVSMQLEADGCKPLLLRFDHPDEAVEWREAISDAAALCRAQQAIKDGAASASYVLSNGESYEGSIVDYKRHGDGQLRTVKGDSISGVWSEGALSGRVTLQTARGLRVEGEWDAAAAVVSGDGVIHYPSGDVYTGILRDRSPRGRGVLQLACGDRLEGIFDGDDIARGEAAVLHYADGRRYEGPVLAMRPHGEGVMHMAGDSDLVSYTGPFVDGKRHGEGRLLFADGESVLTMFDGDAPAASSGSLRLAAIRVGRSRVDSLEEQLARERQALDSLTTAEKCTACGDADVNTVLLDCAHRVLCSACAEGITSCPTCAAPVVRVVTTFDS